MSHRRLAAATSLLGLVLTACSSAPAAPGALEDSPQPIVTGGTGGSSPSAATGVSARGTSSNGGTPAGRVGSAGTSGGSGPSATTGGPATGTRATSTTGAPPPDTSTVHLFTPSEDRLGITPTSLYMCAHAALT
jgi:hypothetical protein